MIPTVQNQAMLQQQGIAGKPTAEMVKALQDAQLNFLSWQDSPLLSSRPICRTSFESDRSSLHSISGGRPFVRPLPAIPHPSAAAHLPAPRSAPPTFWDKPVVHQSQTQLSPRPLPPLPPLSPVPSSDGKESFLACDPPSPCPVYFTSPFDENFEDGCKSTLPSFFPPKLDSVWPYADSGVPPEVPSPTTAQRRRVAKLRRHLGESVVDLLVDRGDTPQLGAGHSRSMSLSGSSADHGGYSSIINHCRSAHGHGANSAETSEDEEEFEDVVSQEHEGGEEGEQADYSWILSNGRVVQTSRRNRYRKKWVFEKGGRRWVVDDYEEVLHALRTL